MDGDGAKARRYRERAESVRKIAEGLPVSSTQRQLLSIAREYERLAKLLDDESVNDASDALDYTAREAALKKPDNSN